MRKYRLKKGVKRFLLIVLLGLLMVNFINNFNKTTKDEIGNTCYGGIVKVCGAK